MKKIETSSNPNTEPITKNIEEDNFEELESDSSNQS